VASCGLGLVGQAVNLPITAWLLPAIGCLLLIFVTAEDRSAGRYFRLTRPVGDITYSSYLWHSPLQMLILLGAGWGLWPVDGLFNDIFFVAYLALVCVLSVFSFKWIERPAQRWLLARFDPMMRSKPLIAAP
jgi:peptidoglycan/LPS O-acetylase OafA/YrhL